MERALGTSDIWEGDLLDREKDAAFLQKLLLAKSKEKETNPNSPAYVLNIDQSWGAGKTFFLKRFQQQLSEDGLTTCYINAWEDDFSEDPMIPIISAFDQQLLASRSPTDQALTCWKEAKSHLLTFATVFAKQAAVGTLKKLIGVNVSELTEELEIENEAVAASDEATAAAAEKILNSFRTKKKHFNDFKTAFSAVIQSLSNEEKSSPVFILIDELDRCKPTYAIALLERIKHLFSVKGAVFVLTTDKQQLAHSVCAVYGEKFDSARYLNRFFDSAYHFPEPSIKAFVEFLVSTKSIQLDKLSAPFEHDQIDFIVKCIGAYNISLRDIEQCMNTLETITSLWDYKAKIQLIYALPLIICNQQSRYEELENLSNRDYKKWFPELNEDSDSNTSYSFNIECERSDNFGRAAGTDTYSFEQLLSEFMHYSYYSLNQLPDHGRRTNTLNYWLYETFSTEYQRVHGASSSLGAKVYSLVLNYPEYVKNARALEQSD